MVTRSLILLESRFMLFVHDNQAQIPNRGKYSRASPYYDASSARGESHPPIQAFPIRQMTVPNDGVGIAKPS